jgi:hypothetical protein
MHEKSFSSDDAAPLARRGAPRPRSTRGHPAAVALRSARAGAVGRAEPVPRGAGPVGVRPRLGRSCPLPSPELVTGIVACAGCGGENYVELPPGTDPSAGSGRALLGVVLGALGMTARARATGPHGAVYLGAGIGAPFIPLRLGERAQRDVTIFELGMVPGSSPIPMRTETRQIWTLSFF